MKAIHTIASTVAGHRGQRQFFLLFSLFCLAFASGAADQPERATGWHQNQSVSGQQQAVVTANPWASRAAWEILNQGGTAIDAAVAAQAMLTLVEPQSSGVGGGAFLLYYAADRQQLLGYDGREEAPSAMTPASFMASDGQALPWWNVVASGRSVGVPGALSMLAAAQHDHGRLPWKQLFSPAIGLAQGGFSVSPRLHQLLVTMAHPNLGREGASRQYFFPDGQALPTGTTLRNPALAATLKTIADEGAGALYHGRLAADIASAAQSQGGWLTTEDLAAYQPRQREPLCTAFRQYQVCSFAPPSAGGIAMSQILAMWQALTPTPENPATPEGAYRFAEILKRVFADRDAYVADPDFVSVPVSALLDRVYLRDRAAGIADMSQGTALPGLALASAKGETPELPCTSHLSIVDQWGNVVSMTTSIEMGFGSGILVDGFLLNNQLTDFSFVPEQDGRAVANRIAPHKRPRSSMSPTLVFDESGHVRLVIGSPGGSRIIPFVAWSLLAYLDGGYTLQQALDVGHVTNQNGPTELEQGTAVAAFAEALQARGETVVVRDLDSGLNAIAYENGRWIAAADGRREGLPLAR